MDEDFINIYHPKSKEGIGGCVKYAMEQIDVPFVKFSVVHNKDDAAALVSVSSDNNDNKSLSLFFVSPKYRKRKDIEEIWRLVWDAIGKDRFFSGIGQINEPANRFYKSIGGKFLMVGDCPRTGEKLNIYYFERGEEWRQH
jgi:hypothetical protein